MNGLQTSSGIASGSAEGMGWRRLGLGVIIGFTLKGVITTAVMVMIMFEFIHF
jgi:hypothetical protein